MLLIVAEDWIPIPRIHRLGYRFASLLVASYKQFPKKNYKKPKLPHPLFIKTKNPLRFFKVFRDSVHGSIWWRRHKADPTLTSNEERLPWSWSSIEMSDVSQHLTQKLVSVCLLNLYPSRLIWMCLALEVHTGIWKCRQRMLQRQTS